MTFSTPFSTVWPAGLALIVLVVSLIIVRRQIRLPKGWWLIALAAIVVRLWVIPALGSHIFDGHEADYWDLFRGVREPTRGGTVMVPAMQWFWWLLGRVLPNVPAIPVLLMAVVGTASIGLAAGAVGTLTRRRVGWAVALLLVVHPTHAAWSTSAYNVILPHFFGTLALYAVARSASRAGAPGAWGMVSASAIALSVSLRLDTATMAIPLLFWALFIRPAGSTVVDRLRVWLLPGVVAIVLAALAAWPLVWPGELPGAGERGLSFAIHWSFFDIYHPFDGLIPATLLLLGLVSAVRAYPRVVLPLCLLVITHHLIMATFDDMGERHTLVVLPALLGILCAGWVSIKRAGFLALVAASYLLVLDLMDVRERFYGSEADFVKELSAPPWSDLERKMWPDEVGDDCGWVAEDARVRRGPVASHFNILDPEEEQGLRGLDGCLHWCVDVQDWRWSSRGVRDRALRLSHLFEMEPAFVVMEPVTGYACLVMDIGQRMIRAPGDARRSDGYHEAAKTIDYPIP
ncbi:MAG: hypothetical protein CL930_15340 [Deltaproteobacteria bacterium]|nr:hypothetical protein [Deltaproteobacteria bacterium]